MGFLRTAFRPGLIGQWNGTFPARNWPLLTIGDYTLTIGDNPSTWCVNTTPSARTYPSIRRPARCRTRLRGYSAEYVKCSYLVIFGKMVIRPARPVDARQIATIHVRTWRLAYRGIIPDEFLDSLSIDEREAVWQQDLLVGHPKVWVAEYGEGVLGWISAARSRDADATGSTGEIWAVYVEPEHWRKGIGHALCDTAEQALFSDGFVEVTLWVLEDNERALKFYKSNGYVVDGCTAKASERARKSLREVRLRKQLRNR